MRLFKGMTIAEAEGKPVQYLGVYVLRWGVETQPQMAFVECEIECATCRFDTRDALKCDACIVRPSWSAQGFGCTCWEQAPDAQL